MGLIGSNNPGVQAHCLRREMSVDFASTLRRLSSMGFKQIELCSFPGCAGNPWGDFGDLATWEPPRIRSALDDAELECVSAHISWEELMPDRLDATVDWLKGVGSPVAVLATLPVPADADLQAWRTAFHSLNAKGTRLAEQGVEFAFHTQNDVWRRIGGRLLADEMFRAVDPALCRIELDPSGALVHGSDWAAAVRMNPGRYFAMHLRDGRRPPEEVPYLPALPLGEGDMDWRPAIATAFDADIPLYILEMEVEAGHDVFAALQTSLDFLEATTSEDEYAG